MTFNNSSPHRQSVRLPDFDYSQPGAYFVTIVTQDRKMLFGQIVGGEMELNDIGRMVRAAWIAIPEHYPMVELGEFVIMPNHFHGIIAICVGESQGINVGRLTQKPPFAENFSKSGGSFTLLFVSNKCNPYFIAK